MHRFHMLQALAPAMYGQILLCREAESGRLVVVKFLSLQHPITSTASVLHVLDDPAQEQRMARRLRTLGPHPNVVTYYDEVCTESSLSLVMEYCADGDLHTYMAQRPDILPFSESEAMRFFTQITNGLEFLHQHGITHRDVSLENVFLHRHECKLADFGLAIHVTKANRSVLLTRRVGKAYYMAPEIVAALARPTCYDPMAADMWSMGILLFILLTGSPLVPLASPEEESFRALMRLEDLQTVITAWGLDHCISQHAVSILNGLLQINPTKRWTIDRLVKAMRPHQQDAVLNHVYDI